LDLYLGSTISRIQTTGGCDKSNIYERSEYMKTSAPKNMTWWIALIVGALGILAELVTIPVLSGFAFWLVVIALALMLIATITKGM